jgi:hypothetical protein
MEELKTKAENLADHAGDYFETQFKLTVLNATDKATGIASQSVTAIVISTLTLFFMLFSGLGLSWWIGTAINSIVGGFFIISGVYALLAALVIIFRKNHIAPFLRNFLIAKIYE